MIKTLNAGRFYIAIGTLDDSFTLFGIALFVDDYELKIVNIFDLVFFNIFFSLQIYYESDDA